MLRQFQEQQPSRGGELLAVFCGYFLLVQNEEHRELLEESYIHVLSLGVNIHVGIWESWNEDSEDFDYYHFRDADTGENLYTEQGSGLITCIHNYTGLSWEEIENLDCEYREAE